MDLVWDFLHFKLPKKYFVCLCVGAVVIVLLLSGLLPWWVAGLLGLDQAYDIALSWVMGQTIWIVAPLVFIYLLCGFFMVVALWGTIWTTGNMLFRGICNTTVSLDEKVCKSVYHTNRRIMRALGFLGLYAATPVIFVAERVAHVAAEANEYICEQLGEKRELRRLYHKEYSGQFVSFLAFKRHMKSNGKEEEAFSSGKSKQKRSGKKRPASTDAYRDAVSLLGLKNGFDEAELECRFRELMKRVHPDKAGPNDLATKVNLARTLIKERMGWA